MESHGHRTLERATSLHKVVSIFTIVAILALLVTYPSLSSAKTVHVFSPPPLEESLGTPKAFETLQSATTDDGDLFISEVDSSGHARTGEYRDDTFTPITEFPSPTNPLTRSFEGIAIGHHGVERRAYVGGKEVSIYRETGPSKWEPAATWNGSKSVSGSFGVGEFGIAVDNSMSVSDPDSSYVYIADGPKAVVDVYEPGSNPSEELEISQIEGMGAGKPFTIPREVAVNDSNGDVVVVDGKNNLKGIQEDVIDILAPETGIKGVYVPVRTLDGPSSNVHFENISSVAVGAPGSKGSGHVFVTAVLAEKERPLEGSSAVYEFKEDGDFIGKIDGPNPEENFSQATFVAVDQGTGDLFVGDRHGTGTRSVVDRFSDDVETPEPVSGTISNLNLNNETHNWEVNFHGEVNPVDAGDATCSFIVRSSLGVEESVPCLGIGSTNEPIANGDVYTDVEAHAMELDPGTEYSYWLEAANSQGVNEGEASQTRTFKTPGPSLSTVWATHVTRDAARLQAVIDPNEPTAKRNALPVSYSFEYGPTSNYGHTANGETIGPGETFTEVKTDVSGLDPGTVYHYRTVVLAEVEPNPEKEPGIHVVERFNGLDKTFTTQGAVGGGTADGRSWEMVSSVNKHGGLILGLNQPGLFEAVAASSTSGNSVSYIAESPIEESVAGNGNFATQIFSIHNKTGWSSEDIAVPHDGETGINLVPNYQFFSADLTDALVVLEDHDRTILSAEATEPTPYIRNQMACMAHSVDCYTPLLTESDVTTGTKYGIEHGVKFITATPDMHHIVLRSSIPLTNLETDSRLELYEWSMDESSFTGHLSLISQVSNSEGAEEFSTAGSVDVGNAGKGTWASGPRAITDDGARIVWTAQSGEESSLFLFDAGLGDSLRLDVVQSGGEDGLPNARFEGMSSDGSHIFFTDTERLVTGASREGADLYECTIVRIAGGLECDLSDLTPEVVDGPSEVQNMALGVSKDGSYIYFVANGVLGTGVARGKCKYELVGTSSCNLFVWHNGVISLVAVLGGGDETDWGEDGQPFHSLGNLSARVSSDGRFALFMSARSLTGYDNDDAVSGMPDQEVYLYDALTKRLSCVSCNPSGARPIGTMVEEGSPLAAFAVQRGSQFGLFSWVASNIPTADELGGFGESLYQPRVLDDSGRVFFNSSDALVPGDINGGEDVYEWEPPGVGTCNMGSSGYSIVSGGCVGLISSGEAASGAGFLDASESGDDAFFVTGAQLVEKDVDTALDVYDAHICGSGWECVSEPVAPPVCTDSDSCRAASPPQPGLFGAPPSATLKGEGNTSFVLGKSIQRKLTRAQKLVRALAACKKKKKKRKLRSACEHSARKKFGKISKPRKGKKGASAKRGGGR